MEVARSNRFHIGFFGRCNVGKSSLLNTLVGQDEAIVSDQAGTTTDVVKKNMEISGVGPCVLLDTAGFDDESELGLRRVDKTRREAARVDLAVMVLDACTPQAVEEVTAWKRFFSKSGIPVLYVLNKADLFADAGHETALWADALQAPCLAVSAREGRGKDELLTRIAAALKQKDEIEDLTGNLVHAGDSVLLVMPQDIQAPKGRLILPQVQTLRNLLDKQCSVMCCTHERMADTLKLLAAPPDLIITDSQVFRQVRELCPPQSRLTSFSVLFARYKGDMPTFLQGASVLHNLRPDARVLIAEACSHTPKNEDIGRVKLPRLLRAKKGEQIQIDVVAGNDFPDDLTPYDLVIHCGACMFTRRHVLSRIAAAQAQGVPVTNYGIAIAELNGILPFVVYPE